MKAKIIINADDFGANKSINDAIKFFLKKSIITSVTTMPNGPYFKEIACLFEEYNNVSFGVHLNLTEFRPLSQNLSYALDIKENMTEKTPLLLMNNIQLINEEWNLQMLQLNQCISNISHIDSHQHIHLHKDLIKISAKIAKNNHIKHMRSFGNIACLTHKNKLRRSVSHLKSILLREKFKYLTNTTPTHYTGSVSEFVAATKIVASNFWKSKTIEIICHPGHKHQNFTIENEILSNGLRKYIDFDYDLISYLDL